MLDNPYEKGPDDFGHSSNKARADLLDEISMLLLLPTAQANGVIASNYLQCHFMMHSLPHLAIIASSEL
jgi:hypothetical protein